MKRSRTCQCLLELDVPKRSRSTPDLGVLERKDEVLGGRVARNNDEVSTLATNSALRVHLQQQSAGEKRGAMWGKVAMYGVVVDGRRGVFLPSVVYKDSTTTVCSTTIVRSTLWQYGNRAVLGWGLMLTRIFSPHFVHEYNLSKPSVRTLPRDTWHGWHSCRRQRRPRKKTRNEMLACRAVVSVNQLGLFSACVVCTRIFCAC